MATVKISALTAAGTIDATADYWPIVTNSLATTQKINRNTFLGITGSPIGSSDTQILTNKTIGNTNTLIVKDTLFTLQDDSDTTKQAQFQLSGITTGTTRTYTLPNASSTIADTSTAQTFTNKTFTSPVITGGSIDNSTVTVDSVAGHTSSTTGTIYGISIASGIITTANSIAAGTVVQGGIGGTQLSTSAITLGYAQTTSTFTLSSSQTTPTQVTGLSITVTIPSGGRRIKITAYTYACSPSAGVADLQIWDGTVNSGTLLQQSNSSSNQGVVVIATHTPPSGSKTYNVGIVNSGANNVVVAAAATSPAYILVEAI